ncbi:MAG: biotin/lipoyl-binding protein [Gammaproteobacteria bacterium]|nr:biotin/lipoyl-binding protein [Gammaproteobacteria bacterium]MBI5618601.1 biotin/lipoyl-binding protein [Gammaproteobacteria bacterium]
MSIELNLDGTPRTVSVAARKPGWRLTVDGTPYTVSEEQGEDCVLLTVGERRYRVWRALEGNRVHLKIGGRTFSLGYEEEVSAAAHAGAAGHEVHADMPGVVVDVHCGPDAIVSAGDALLVIESMKMQITITAPRDGVVAMVHVAKNQPFEKGNLLVSLRDEEA